MRLYFVRHGESEANISRMFSTRDFEIHPLTAKGTQQAQDLAAALRDLNLSAMYSSPLLRARQTAEILNAARGLEIQVTPALNENDPGDLEGRADAEAWGAYRTLFETWMVRRDPDARIPNGESFNEMRARFVPFVEDVTRAHAGSDDNILLVTHGGILHTMLPQILPNVSYEFGYGHLLDNAAVVVAEQTNHSLVCVSWAGVEPPRA